MNIRDRIKELRRVPANELRPNPRNWRKHPEKQLNAIRGVLAEVGFAGAEIARELDDGTLELIDGHARAEVAGSAEVPVLILDVDEAEANKILATFDPIGAMAESDAVKLDQVLRDVDTGSEAVQEMLAELATGADLYLDDKPEIVEDEVPEPPSDPITNLGDLWTLGRHRLLCGDSTSESDVGRLMNGETANLLLTDPPYGINISSNPVRQKHKKSDWDSKPIDPTVFAKSADVYIVWGGNYFNLPANKGFFVWDKKQPENFTLAMVEMAQTNIDIPAKMFRKSVTNYSKQHPTQKPVELLAWCLKYANGLIFDPFLGSGTTLIAAEQLDRTCYGLEISPEYCDVIVERWQNLTGKKATRENGTA